MSNKNAPDEIGNSISTSSYKWDSIFKGRNPIRLDAKYQIIMHI